MNVFIKKSLSNFSVMGGVNTCKKLKYYNSTTECYHHINPFEYEKSHGNNDAYVTGADALEFQM